MNHSAQYFDRANWAFHNAHNDKLAINMRGHLTAVAVHACQSLRESLELVSQENPDDVDLATAVKTLPFTELIENIRNTDLHGWPLPICDPKIQMVAMVSKPGKPITLSSSNNVAVSMQMDGLTPRVRRSPNNLKHGKITIGGATVSFACNNGQLIVHDFSTGKDYVLLDVLKTFLEKCYPIIKSRISKPNDQDEPTSTSET